MGLRALWGEAFGDDAVSADIFGETEEDASQGVLLEEVEVADDDHLAFGAGVGDVDAVWVVDEADGVTAGADVGDDDDHAFAALEGVDGGDARVSEAFPFLVGAVGMRCGLEELADEPDLLAVGRDDGDFVSWDAVVELLEDESDADFGFGVIEVSGLSAVEDELFVSDAGRELGGGDELDGLWWEESLPFSPGESEIAGVGVGSDASVVEEERGEAHESRVLAAVADLEHDGWELPMELEPGEESLRDEAALGAGDGGVSGVDGLLDFGCERDGEELEGVAEEAGAAGQSEAEHGLGGSGHAGLVEDDDVERPELFDVVGEVG